jgi:hypothetical protein
VVKNVLPNKNKISCLRVSLIKLSKLAVKSIVN